LEIKWGRGSPSSSPINRRLRVAAEEARVLWGAIADRFVEQSDAIPIILRGLAEKPIAGARRSQ
jgi:hypothetical protein